MTPFVMYSKLPSDFEMGAGSSKLTRMSTIQPQRPPLYLKTCSLCATQFTRAKPNMNIFGVIPFIHQATRTELDKGDLP